MSKERYLQLEDPDTVAVVDFLSKHAVIKIEVEDGKLLINVRLPHGDDASSWDDHGFTVDMPEYEKREGE